MQRNGPLASPERKTRCIEEHAGGGENPPRSLTVSFLNAVVHFFAWRLQGRNYTVVSSSAPPKGHRHWVDVAAGQHVNRDRGNPQTARLDLFCFITF